MEHLVEFDTELVERHRDALERAEIICTVGLFDLPRFSLAGAGAVLRAARKAGKATLFDSGGDPDGWPPATVGEVEKLLPDVSYVVINADEAAGICGESDPWRACDVLRDAGASSVIIKCGPDGSYGLDASGRHRSPARATTPADAVGAGDSYDAGFLWGLSRGLSFEASMQAATDVATIYISRLENRYPTAAEVSSAEAELPGPAQAGFKFRSSDH